MSRLGKPKQVDGFVQSYCNSFTNAIEVMLSESKLRLSDLRLSDKRLEKADGSACS